MGWMATKFYDIHGTQKVNTNDFGDSLIFPIPTSCKISSYLSSSSWIHKKFSEDVCGS